MFAEDCDMSVPPPSSNLGAPIGFQVSAGLRSLAVAAQEGPLPFAISMYCGQMVITGRVAPADWFYAITKSGFAEELHEDIRRNVGKRDRDAAFSRLNPPAQQALDRADAAEEDFVGEDLTLIDVQIFPAVATQGTRSGGQSLPVARVPYGSVDVWWVVSGETIRGRGGANVGWGFLFPIGN
jgi:hypothetical protein